MSLFLEPMQEAEISPHLRAATLSSRGLIASIVRTPAGIRLDIGLITQAEWRKIRKALDP